MKQLHNSILKSVLVCMLCVVWSVGWTQDVASLQTPGFKSQTPKSNNLNIQNPKDVTVSGRVTSETGEAMPGVNVAVKGTTKGTSTGADGTYSLSGVPENATLAFSFIGYATQEIAVGSRSTIDIQLQPDVTSLEDVVVVAYGTQKKSSVVAAISSISSKDIAALPVPSMEQALQGRVASVLVTNNGSPGEAPIVRIRGINSINYASNPFYVVDGIPSVGNFNNFDSKDIESVEVLKDASSAALYGSRASAGVILITTKKGTRDGKIHVNLDSYVGVQNAWRQLDLLNTSQYVQYGTALLNNAGAALPARFSNLNVPNYPGSTQTLAQTNTDWQKAIFRSAAISQTNVSVSGGNDKSRFYASGGYFKQDGIMLGTSYERYNFRINSDHKIGKIFTFGQTLLVAYGLQKKEPSGGGRTQIKHAINLPPYLTVENPSNIGGYNGPSTEDGQDAQNPVRIALQDLDQLTTVSLLGSVFLEAEITKWLKFRSNVGINYSTQREYGYNPIYVEGGFNSRTQADVTDTRNNAFSPVFTNQLTFDKTFDKHNINAVGALEYQTTNSIYSKAFGKYGSNSVKEVTGGSTNQFVDGGRNEFAIYSYIGRLNYEYAGKYLFSASIRRDGASSFAPGKKFGNFPSLGVGWVVSEEGFMKDLPAISQLKLRASWGKVGYIPGNYLWQSLIQTNINAVTSGGTLNQGAYYSSLSNKDLEWEITTMKNAGVDLGFFRNKLTFSGEYYERLTDNLIYSVPVATSAGFASPAIVNIASMKSWGYEFVAGFNESIKAFKWSVSANVGITKNNVISLNTPKDAIPAGNGGSDYGGYDITRTEAGQPVQSFYGWQTDGLFQNNADAAKIVDSEGPAKAGDIRFKDNDGDGKISIDDRVYLGSFIPKFNFGTNLAASYKGFDVNVFFQGVQGNKVYDGTRVLIEGGLRLFNASTTVLNAWTPTNTGTDVPRVVNGDPHHNTRTSDRFLEDGSYLRLKNVSLGYTIPEKLLKAGTMGTLSRLRIYISSQNLLTFTKYKGYDPEVGSRFNGAFTQGIDYGQFPQARSFTVGIQAGF